MTLIIILAAVAVLALMIIGAYNKFVTLKNHSEEASAQIDAHLKQRYDLIPNLVETVKGYAKHEEKTLTAVINARNAALSATSLEEKDKASNTFEGALKTVFALSESYPELKANTQFVTLQNQLKEIEESLLQSRKYYNAVVKTFNNAIMTFPNSVIASMFGSKFTKLPYLEVSEKEKENVKVSF